MVPSLSSHKTKVYNPKTFFPHAALLGQAFAHCPIFPTAASRRSLDRISVPMWPFNLSVRLLIVDLVSRYLTNYLIRREPISMRIAPLTYQPCNQYALCGISARFHALFPSQRQVAHALLTRPPLSSESICRSFNHRIPVRLECVMHAASVYPEPGSNSLNMIYQGNLGYHHTEFVCSTYFKELINFKFKRIFGVFYILSLLFNFQGASLLLF